VALAYTNTKRNTLFLAGAGFKGFKVNVFNPNFQEPFLNDVKLNYKPIQGSGIDSLIGAKMNSPLGKSLNGTYSYFLHFGVLSKKKWHPSANIYIGREEFLLHDRSFESLNGAPDGDTDYVGMNTRFYEIKLGIALPMKSLLSKPYRINFNIGYKLTDYGDFTFHKTPMASYTDNFSESDYRFGGKFTASVSFVLWSERLQ